MGHKKYLMKEKGIFEKYFHNYYNYFHCSISVPILKKKYEP